MAAIDFPSSPTNGQIFVANGVSYIYNSTKGYWVASNYDAAPRGYTGSRGLQGYTGSRGGSVTTYTSATAPSAPTVGDFWFDTEDGNLLVYYGDGDSQQWIGVSGPRGVMGYAGSRGYTGSQGIQGVTGYTGSAGTADTTAVLTATSGATAGGVGTYALLFWSGAAQNGPGTTVSGSVLYPSNLYAYSTTAGYATVYGSMSGTWRLLGQTGYYNGTVALTRVDMAGSLFLRIA